MKIVIAGCLAPVRLTWVPFFKALAKNGFIYVKADTEENIYVQDRSFMLLDHKFTNASDFKLYLCGASDH